MVSCDSEPVTPDLDWNAEPLTELEGAQATLPPPPNSELWSGNVVQGYNAEFRVLAANPFDVIWVLWGSGDPVSGPCFPQMGGLCSELANPHLMRSVVADASGEASFTVHVPNNAPMNHISFEAWGGGGPNAYKTPAIMRVVQDEWPIELITGSPGSQGPTGDPFTANSAWVNADTLFLDVEYSGGCAPHDFESWWNGAYMLSLPVQMNLEVVHDANGDLCRALIFEELALDLTELRRGYGYGGPATIVIHAPDGNTVHYDFP